MLVLPWICLPVLSILLVQDCRGEDQVRNQLQDGLPATNLDVAANLGKAMHVDAAIVTKPSDPDSIDLEVASALERYARGFMPHVRYGKEVAPHLRYGKEVGPHVRYGKEAAPHVRYGKEAAPHVRYGKEAAPHVRYGKEVAPHVRYGKEVAPHVRYGKEVAPHVRYGKEVAPHVRYGKEVAPHVRYGKEVAPHVRYGKEVAPHVRYGKEVAPHVRYGKEVAPHVRYGRVMRPNVRYGRSGDEEAVAFPEEVVTNEIIEIPVAQYERETAPHVRYGKEAVTEGEEAEPEEEGEDLSENDLLELENGHLDSLVKTEFGHSLVDGIKRLRDKLNGRNSQQLAFQLTKED